MRKKHNLRQTVFKHGDRTMQQIEYLGKVWGCHPSEVMRQSLAQSYVLARADKLNKLARQSEDEWLEENKDA